MPSINSRRVTRGSMLLVVALLVGACKKDGNDAMSDTTAMAATPSVSESFAVGDVDVGKHIGADKKISDKSDSFAPMDTMYASVQTKGAGTNRTIMARWTYQDGQTVDEQSATVSPTGEAWTEFHVMKPSGWPKGKYTLAVMLDGAQVNTKEVEVK